MTYPNRGERSYFDATCAQCGSACKVPFKPNGRKEVFCSKCFETNGGGSRESSFEAPRGPRAYGRREFGTGGQDRQMFGATCDQCGERCEVPFRPTSGKPVLCSHCFTGKNEDRGSQPRNLDLEVISAKLDRILTLLTPPKPEPDDESNLQKKVAKEITSKILEEIEVGSGKKVVARKKKAKVSAKKK